MTREEKERLKDYFEAWELIEYLQIDVEDVIERYENEIEEALEDIQELMAHGTRGESHRSR